MKKGVSVDQVARVTKGFADAGILVHAYLMYGFPTQTVQDTVDALELVRQLFAAGCIQSGFFHRFACTVHSPVGLDPAAYGVQPAAAERRQAPVTFAKNDVGFIDPTGTDHDALGRAPEEGHLQLHARRRPGHRCAAVVRRAGAQAQGGAQPDCAGLDVKVGGAAAGAGPARPQGLNQSSR